MPWLPPDVIESYHEDTHAEWNKRKVFETEFVKIDRVAVENKKLADHPIRIGYDPENYCQVVAKFAHVTPGTDGDHYGNDQGR
jgi:hypothetical protein